MGVNRSTGSGGDPLDLTKPGFSPGGAIDLVTGSASGEDRSPRTLFTNPTEHELDDDADADGDGDDLDEHDEHDDLDADEAPEPPSLRPRGKGEGKHAEKVARRDGKANDLFIDVEDLSTHQQATQCMPAELGTIDCLDEKLSAGHTFPHRETVDLHARYKAVEQGRFLQTSSNGHENAKGCKTSRSDYKVCCKSPNCQWFVFAKVNRDGEARDRVKLTTDGGGDAEEDDFGEADDLFNDLAHAFSGSEADIFGTPLDIFDCGDVELNATNTKATPQVAGEWRVVRSELKHSETCLAMSEATRGKQAKLVQYTSKQLGRLCINELGSGGDTNNKQIIEVIGRVCKGVDKDAQKFKQLAARVMKEMKLTTSVKNGIEMIESLGQRAEEAGHHFKMEETDNAGMKSMIVGEIKRKTEIEIQKAKQAQAEHKQYKESVGALAEELMASPLDDDENGGEKLEGDVVRTCLLLCVSLPSCV